MNRLLGDEVGQLYAERYFSPQSKVQVQDMVAKIIATFRKRIEAVPWMAASTKAEAQAKLNTLYVGIGYPESWIDYSAYDVRPDDLFGNEWGGRLFQYHRQVARLGAPVDRKEWSMTPQTVNAVNLPLQNALNFPAAILQIPFFDPRAPAAHNYGAIGAVIGHEISHTFDTEGSTFDAKGQLRNWWTPSDLSRFEAAAAALAKQYDAYEPLPGLFVNGEQTLAENIADLAGLAASYDGYHAFLAGKTATSQEGFTGDQQFFIAFAQNYASKAREAALRRQVLTDGTPRDSIVPLLYETLMAGTAPSMFNRGKRCTSLRRPGCESGSEKRLRGAARSRPQGRNPDFSLVWFLWTEYLGSDRRNSHTSSRFLSNLRGRRPLIANGGRRTRNGR